jgi:hypothetical protein
VSERRFCVFCGTRPQNKTKEHVVPQWLIELTGDPNRPCVLGPIFGKGLLTFSFKNFVFPACDECNNSFSEFETKVKHVVLKLLDEEAISAEDVSLLLDWFDKVRIGLWLGYGLYLNKNKLDIEPNFYISQRVRKSDRILMIVRSEVADNRLLFSGINTPLFGYHPISMGLTVNNLGFINTATYFVASKELGLPFPRKLISHSNVITKCPMEPGTHKLARGYSRITKSLGTTLICQPCYETFLSQAGASEYYDNDFVRSQELEKGVGRPAYQTNGRLKYLPLQPSTEWLPEKTWDYEMLPSIVAAGTLKEELRYSKRALHGNEITPAHEWAMSEQSKFIDELTSGADN